jgi:hypothetical protein
MDTREFDEVEVRYIENRKSPGRIYVLEADADVLKLSKLFFSAGELASSAPREWVADIALTFRPKVGSERAIHVNIGKKAWYDAKTGMEWPMPEKFETVLTRALLTAKEIKQQQ